MGKIIRRQQQQDHGEHRGGNESACEVASSGREELHAQHHRCSALTVTSNASFPINEGNPHVERQRKPRYETNRSFRCLILPKLRNERVGASKIFTNRTAKYPQLFISQWKRCYLNAGSSNLPSKFHEIAMVFLEVSLRTQLLNFRPIC